MGSSQLFAQVITSSLPLGSPGWSKEPQTLVGGDSTGAQVRWSRFPGPCNRETFDI